MIKCAVSESSSEHGIGQSVMMMQRLRNYLSILICLKVLLRLSYLRTLDNIERVLLPYNELVGRDGE